MRAVYIGVDVNSTMTQTKGTVQNLEVWTMFTIGVEAFMQAFKCIQMNYGTQMLVNFQKRNKRLELISPDGSVTLTLYFSKKKNDFKSSEEKKSRFPCWSSLGIWVCLSFVFLP